MSQSQINFDQAMTQGHSAAWDQDWEAAAEHYRQALEIFPNHPNALVSLGLAYYELGKYEQSLRYYAKVTQIKPDDPLAFEKVAQISEMLDRFTDVIRASLKAASLYLEAGDSERAIENLVRVTHVDNNNLAAHSRLAYIYERRGQKGPAVMEYLAVASLFQRKGEIENARKAINHALTILPANKECLEALKQLDAGRPLPVPVRPLADVRRGGEGSTAPKQVGIGPSITHGRDPIDEARERAMAGLAEIILEAASMEAGDHERSSRGFQSVKRNASRSFFSRQVDKARLRTHLNQAISHQSLGQYGEAEVELEKAIEAGLSHPAAFFDLGYLYSQSDRLESAVRNLQKATLAEEFALASHLLIGDIYRKFGRLNEATVEYMMALQYADAHVVPVDRSDEVIQLYETIIESVKTQTDTHEMEKICAAIEDMLRRPDWEERLRETRKDFQIDISNGPAIPLGEVFIQAGGSQVIDAIMNIHQLARAGHLRSAMEEAFHALHFAPTYLPLHNYIGEILLQQDRISEAVAKFNTIAKIYQARGDLSHAVQLLRRVIKITPLNVESRQNLIEILLNQGQVNDVISEYLDLADVYYHLADLEQARKVYYQTLKLAESTTNNQGMVTQILYRIADIDLQRLDWRQALQVFLTIKQTKPSETRARENLIELYIRLSQIDRAHSELGEYLDGLKNEANKNKAISFLERISRDYPDHVFLRRRLAHLYREASRIDEAVHELDKAGKTLLEAGDVESAIQVLEEILELKPTDAESYYMILAQLRGEDQARDEVAPDHHQ